MTTEITAHDWKYVSKDRIQRWTNSLDDTEQVKPQNEDKRPVSVDIMSWVGMSLGAKHYTLTIREEDNHWWSDTENAWVLVTCSTESRGFSLEAECYSEDEAKQIAELVINTVFGKPRTKKRSMWVIDKY